MDTALWVVQILLALAFLMFGFMKLTKSKDELYERMAWVEDFEPNIIKGIGVLEILAVVGLILPMLLNILPLFTPLAAIGLILTMAGAAYTHFRRNEMPNVAPPVILLLLSAFVAYGRIDLLIGG
jgi:uncharacterized membrane protein YphA (DoxX/SURF4 family)